MVKGHVNVIEKLSGFLKLKSINKNYTKIQINNGDRIRLDNSMFEKLQKLLNDYNQIN